MRVCVKFSAGAKARLPAGYLNCYKEGIEMNDFPNFMKSPGNLIGKSSQYTDEIEGYVFNGADGSQMAFWTCFQDSDSKEHTHDFDEYFVVVQGRYTVFIGQKVKHIEVGQECCIPKGTPHSGKAIAGTRTIHCFGGKRV